MKFVRIVNTELNDLDFACELYHKAIAYQKMKGYPEYHWDDRDAQKQQIVNGSHYKVIIANEIAAIFNVQFQDKLIWRELDIGKSIYLHGVLTNPEHKGKKLFGDILNWAIEFANSHRKENIRLDTWYENENLLKYYMDFGFRKIENFQTPETINVPKNCRGNKVTLMEYQI